MDQGFSFADVWARFSSSDTLIAAFLTIALPLIIAAVQNWIAPRVRLRYGTLINILMLPPKEDGTQGVLRVQKVRVLNTGRKSAEHVEVIFNWKPQHIEQYPHIVTGENHPSDGRYVVQIQRLNGGESIDFTMASDQHVDLPSIIYVRASGQKGKQIEYRTQVWFSLPIRTIILTMFAAGGFFIVYCMVLLFGWLLFGRSPF